MFTGIIEELGTVKEIIRGKDNLRFVIYAKTILEDAKIDDSISVNGVCLTVIDIKNNSVSFDIVPETIRRTNLSDLKVSSRINLERAIKSGQGIGGHFVTGHIDYKAEIIELIKDAGGIRMKFFLPVEFSPFLAEKGSIAIDGVSLTVAEAGKDYFSAYLIPHTLKNTTLGLKRQGDFVNVETDILAKYVNRKDSTSVIDEDFLKRYGYL